MPEKNLGCFIKKERTYRGWTQHSLGEMCGVQRAHISRIESDINRASLDVFIKICKAFGADTERLNQEEASGPFDTIEPLPISQIDNFFYIVLG